MSFRGNPNVVNLTDAQTITGEKTFSGVSISGKLTAQNTSNSLIAAANQNNNYVVTTTAKNKAKNGYYKLGNGLIIQWGYVSAGGDKTKTITFSTPFTTTNFGVTLSCSKYSDSSPWPANVESTSTTGFTAFQTHTKQFWWVAIGY